MGGTGIDEDRLVAWLQRFVRRPSEQSELAEADPAVHAFIREGVAPLLAEAGMAHRFDACGNLLAEAGPADTGRSLAIVAYAMTHPAAAMRDPFAGECVDTPEGRAVRGRGVAEQKAALAAALGAVLDAVRADRLGGRLVFAVLTAGETGRHDAIAAAMAALGAWPRAAVICIGTGNAVAIGNKGRIDFDVIVGGRAAHSSTPWQGVDAIAGAARVLAQLEAFVIPVPPHPAFGPATLTPTAIRSGPAATHTIQDHVRITCDRRLLPGEEAAAAFAAITAAVRLDPPWSLAFERGPVMFANELAPDAALVRQFARAQASAGLPAACIHCSFALDAGFFGQAGVECVMFGPGTIDEFHSSEERVRVSDLVAAANAYRALIREVLAERS